MPMHATRPATRFTAPLWGALLVAAGLLLSGCYGEGGTGFSIDRYTYISTSWNPKTVSLVDTRVGETIWSVDVPVGQQLVVGFYVGKGGTPQMPDLMYWGLMEGGAGGGATPNRMPVPPYSARLIELTFRPAPEMPGAVLPNRGPKEPTETIEPVERPAAAPAPKPAMEEHPDSAEHEPARPAPKPEEPSSPPGG